MTDDFKGDNAQLVSCIESLISLDADGALVPHGLGGHARGLLAAAASRLALSTNAGEAAPVAFEWPKLEKPARAGGGVFRAGVSSRFVVEAAQRLYEASEVDRNRTPEEMQEDERKRRSLWDMIHGSPHPPAAVHGQSASTEGEPINDGWNREAGTSLNPRHSAPKVDPSTAELGTLRWLLNITTEFDRKDVRTRQAARLLDDYTDASGKTNREHLESLWKKLEQAATPPAAIPAAPSEDVMKSLEAIEIFAKFIQRTLDHEDFTAAKVPGLKDGLLYSACERAMFIQNSVKSLRAALAQPAPVQPDIEGNLDFEPDEQHTVADMANIGYALIEALPKGYAYNDSPAEIVADLQNEIADLEAAPVQPTKQEGETLWTEIMRYAETEVIPNPARLKEWAWQIRRWAEAAPVQQEAVPPMPPTDDPQPSHLEGYDESPDEWVSRNIETVRWMMDNHHAIRAALQPTQGAKGGA